MKTPFLFALCTAVLLTACGGGASTPSDVASKFLDHTNKMEFKEAKKYATKATGEVLDMIGGMAAMMPKEDPKSFKILSEKIDGDKATVTYRTDGKEEDETLNLVKEDGKWLVNMSKEDMNKEESGDMDFGEEDGGEWEYEEETEEAAAE
ncbi:MAG: DUF4878 domain-containing protein [Flavobacteriales bacterium]|nr:DUF4878 domain-containing protein [Flavobacteriales bacterium]